MVRLSHLSIRKFLQIFVIIIAVPALLINLGLFPLISDEPTRGIVTLEMLLSGNFIHPTINGELYFNKPPLFNWLQASFITLSGSMDEFIFRLPSIISLIGICFIIYFSTRKHLGNYAVVAALSFLVSGRVLFWDSFMGLIDLTYSFVTFGSFIWLIHFNKKGNYYYFFIGSYFLASIGFLMKGIPSVAFQSLSILVILFHDNKLKKLLSFPHLLGILITILIVGGYYWEYSNKQLVLPTFLKLFDESNRLQATEGYHVNWWFHLLEFPFKLVYEFAPVTILSFLLLSRKIRKITFEVPFIRYCGLLFIINIIIYWVSADMRSRYLFMLIPLLSIVLIKAYTVGESLDLKIFRVIRLILLAASLMVALSSVMYPLWFETKEFNHVRLISFLMISTSLILLVIAIRNKQLVMLSLIGVLLIARIAFNLFNLPARLNSYPDEGYKQGEIKAAQLSAGHPLYIFNKTQINHDATFYITRERMEILKRTKVTDHKNAFYIVDKENLNIFASNSKKYHVLYSFRIKLNESRLFLVTK